MTLSGMMKVHALHADLCGRIHAAVSPAFDPDSAWCLLEPCSMGDGIYDLSLLESFRRRHCGNGERIIFVTSPQVAKVAGLFSGFVDAWVVVPESEELYAMAQTCARSPRFDPCSILNLVPGFHYDTPLARANRLNPEIQVKKLLLGLSLADRPSFPNLTLPGQEAGSPVGPVRKVYFIPTAHSCAPLDADLVREICSRLLEAGCQVFFDAFEKLYDPPRGCIQVTPTLEEAMALARASDLCLTYRSGMTDLLALAAPRLAVLYPHPTLFLHGLKACGDPGILTTPAIGLRDREISLFDVWREEEDRLPAGARLAMARERSAWIAGRVLATAATVDKGGPA